MKPLLPKQMLLVPDAYLACTCKYLNSSVKQDFIHSPLGFEERSKEYCRMNDEVKAFDAAGAS